jgi:hypothetical protein
METRYIILLIILITTLWLVLRPIVLWYYKIYAIVANLEDVVKELKELNDKIKEAK